MLDTPQRTIAPHFQRSINLIYDVGDADYIAGYIPTPNGAAALATMLENSSPDARQRTHILHAAYGSGKSLLGLVLSALVRQDAPAALDRVVKRIEQHWPHHAKVLQSYRKSKRRFLPVLLSGDEGHLQTALLRGLKNALAEDGVPELELQTPFKAALLTIQRWEEQFPELITTLETRLEANEDHSVAKLSLEALKAALKQLSTDALRLFESIYPTLTGGARFDRYAGPNLNEVYGSIASALKSSGYDGIFVIWDEFGRFLEARTGDAFGSEAAMLQDFAEFCNRSGNVHIVLITHRLFSVYASGLPLRYQQEWARIAERFRPHDLSSDPSVSYRLVIDAIETSNGNSWQSFLEQHYDHFSALTARTLELRLFDEWDDTRLRSSIIEAAWPLHPLTVYALPRISSQVAQNERTLFTFLAAPEAGTLATHLEALHGSQAWWLAKLDMVWDYFASAIRSDVLLGHTIWSGVMHALGKCQPDDELAKDIVKSLGILLLLGEKNLQTQARLGGAIPTTEILAWAVDAEEKQVITRLEHLSLRRAVKFRQADGYWSFTRGSDIDLEAEIRAALDQRVVNRLQMRQLLERNLPPSFHLPRRYNQERSMTRFFWGLYRWADELQGINTDTFLKQVDKTGYADGVVCYCLATNAVERQQAIDTIKKLPQSRFVFVIPKQALLIEEPLSELIALRDLQNNHSFMAQDERLLSEVDYLLEDVLRRLERVLHPLIETSGSGATWWRHDGSTYREESSLGSGLSPLLSKIMFKWFPKSPILNNESLNKHEPSKIQEKAASRVIDILLQLPTEGFPEDLGLSGYGADWLILRTLLIKTRLMQPTGQDSLFQIQKPEENPELLAIWDEVHAFLDQAHSPQQIEPLIDKLLSPPYGLRRGVLPLLLTAIMHSRLPVLTLRKERRIVSPITGETFINLVRSSAQFTIEVGKWDDKLRVLWRVLEEEFKEYLTEQERHGQPLEYLSVGMLRWLQSLPRYCRDTNQLPLPAHTFRKLIRKAQSDPSTVLLYDLLELLEPQPQQAKVPAPPHPPQPWGGLRGGGLPDAVLGKRLSELKNQIATAYQALLYELNHFTVELFAADSLTPIPNARTALNFWLTQLSTSTEEPIQTFHFNDALVTRLIKVNSLDFDTDMLLIEFWNHLSDAVLGIGFHDWNDQSVKLFQSKLKEAKERAEREIVELSENDAITQVQIRIPKSGESQGGVGQVRTYRFRPSELSAHGQRILENFKSTLKIAGRPLSPDERRQVVLGLLHYVLEGTEQDEEQSKRTGGRR